MTTLRLLSSLRAENATRRLMLVYASYQGWRTADLVSRPRLARLRAGDPWNALSGPAVIAQLVSTAEHFSAGLLMDNAVGALDGTPLIARELWKRQRNRVDSTWQSQMDAWKNFFEVDFQSVDYYDRLEPFIEARNSVLHGLGTLTRRQREDKEATVKRLQAGGIDVVGSTLRIPHAAVTDCRRAAQNLILWLDLEDQRRALRV